MNRKDDHIQYALQQAPKTNDFDRIRFVHHAIGKLNLTDINLSVRVFDRVFPTPLYINAMTGGSEQAKQINQSLASLANVFKLPMASGSLSAALKDKRQLPSYTTILETYPEGFRIANVGADKNVAQALEAIDLIKASALQVHLNLTQELIMPEGDRDFSSWSDHIKTILKQSPVPVIIKEVGFGMSYETMKTLSQWGAHFIDVSGQGGTNFAQIENERRNAKLDYLNTWGLSTVESLLEAQRISHLTVLASGGIRHPLDVIKALRLGATMVGLSSYFLNLVSQYSHEEAVMRVSQFIDELKLIMVLLHAKNIRELVKTNILMDETLVNFIQQRQSD